MEKPLYPSPYMRITQGYGVGTHKNRFYPSPIYGSY